MEACGGAHDWARHLREQGHEVKLMAPHYVKPYVKTNKNDLRDAEAIAEAVTRPSMRFVPIKNVEQQDLQALHRVRERLMGARTALVNEIRGLLAEYGIVLHREYNPMRFHWHALGRVWHRVAHRCQRLSPRLGSEARSGTRQVDTSEPGPVRQAVGRIQADGSRSGLL